MSTNPKKVRNANNAKSKQDDASLLLEAIRGAVREKRAALATKLVEIAEGGNSTMLKTILDLVTQGSPSDEASRIETLKRLSELEAEAASSDELSEETAEGFPSGREPE